MVAVEAPAATVVAHTVHVVEHTVARTRYVPCSLVAGGAGGVAVQARIRMDC
jgi:hypothetical protein